MFLRDAESAVAFEHSFAQALQTPPTAREEQHLHRAAASVPTEFKPWPERAEDYSDCQSMPADHQVPTSSELLWL